jgi:hypothetical protein
MTSKLQIARLYLCVFLLLLVTVVPAYTGPGSIGLVAGSTNASVGGKTLPPDTTLFSGDRLEVNDGVAVVALGSTSRMIFHRDTVASFLGDSEEVTVLLGQGDVSLFHGENTMPVRVRVGDISVVPVSRFGTLGEVAAGNGMVAVTTKDGRMRVEGNGQTIILDKGGTITVAARASAPKGARGSGVPRPSFLSLQSTPHPSPMQIPDTGPSAGSLSTTPIRLSSDSTVKADASRAALDAVVAGGSAPVMAPTTSDTIGRALNPLAAHTPLSSPHNPHH